MRGSNSREKNATAHSILVKLGSHSYAQRRYERVCLPFLQQKALVGFILTLHDLPINLLFR